jgi:hypothetical protein
MDLKFMYEYEQVFYDKSDPNSYWEWEVYIVSEGSPFRLSHVIGSVGYPFICDRQFFRCVQIPEIEYFIINLTVYDSAMKDEALHGSELRRLRSYAELGYVWHQVPREVAAEARTRSDSMKDDDNKS